MTDECCQCHSTRTERLYEFAEWDKLFVEGWRFIACCLNCGKRFYTK